MKSNAKAGFNPIHEGSYPGSAGVHETVTIMVGERDDQYRAEASVWNHDQDASKEGIVDRVAAKGASVREALLDLGLIAHGWNEDRTRGLARAIDEALDDLT